MQPAQRPVRWTSWTGPGSDKRKTTGPMDRSDRLDRSIRPVGPTSARAVPRRKAAVVKNINTIADFVVDELSDRDDDDQDEE